jgi:hypothetical protein|tara:strand:+ start:465 stop:797 length:333 start_codon:yes stop_codon:yes gene_type:complete
VEWRRRARYPRRRQRVIDGTLSLVARSLASKTRAKLAHVRLRAHTMSQSVSMTQRAAAAPRRVAMRTQRGGAVARSSRAVVRAGRFETERTYIMIKCVRDARRDATRRRR